MALRWGTQSKKGWVVLTQIWVKYCFMVSDLPYHLIIDHSPSTSFYLFSQVR